MKPTEVLSNEHRVIEQVLDCLAAFSRQCERTQAIEVETSKKLLEVLSTFADACHHGKEENQLFPALERCGLPRHVGPMAVMLSEHDMGRAAIRDMRQAADEVTSHGADAARRFVRAADAYVELLRDHIAKEDGVLFPLAESLLKPADKEAVLAAFARVESLDVGAGVHERMLALADELAEQFGVAKAAQRSPSIAAGGCCHGHHH
jgi:hemerythrin-like domain-containing protein